VTNQTLQMHNLLYLNFCVCKLLLYLLDHALYTEKKKNPD